MEYWIHWCQSKVQILYWSLVLTFDQSYPHQFTLKNMFLLSFLHSEFKISQWLTKDLKYSTCESKFEDLFRLISATPNSVYKLVPIQSNFDSLVPQSWAKCSLILMFIQATFKIAVEEAQQLLDERAGRTSTTNHTVLDFLKPVLPVQTPETQIERYDPPVLFSQECPPPDDLDLESVIKNLSKLALNPNQGVNHVGFPFKNEFCDHKIQEAAVL